MGALASDLGGDSRAERPHECPGLGPLGKGVE